MYIKNYYYTKIKVNNRLRCIKSVEINKKTSIDIKFSARDAFLE